MPYVVSLASVIAGGIDGRPDAATSLPAVLAALAVAAVIGLANGADRQPGSSVHGFIATLGMGLILTGYLATNYQGSYGSAPRVVPADRRHPDRPGPARRP